MVKRILALLIISVMALTIGVSATNLVDIDGYVYEDEIRLLHALEIIEGKAGDLYMPEDTLTRAEMVTIVLRLLKVPGSIAADFQDVPASHWASLNIGTAYNKGIIDGVSETEFAPEQAVTFPQAVKMIMVALGYRVAAEEDGGYPGGYLSWANQTDVTKGLTVSDEPISRGMMAKLVVNALDAPLLSHLYYGENKAQAVDETKNLLNTYLKIYKMEGTVDATGMTNVQAGKVKKGQILLGGKALNVGESDAERFLGHIVTLYARLDESGTYTVLHIEDKSSTRTLTVDVDSILPESSATVLYYEENDKVVNKSISASARWIVNGQETAASATLLDFEMGSVTLVGQGNDSFHTVIIESYKNYIVDSLRLATDEVIFKNSSEGMASLTLKLDAQSPRVEILNADGTKASLDTLMEWDVLSIFESADHKLYRIIRCGDQIMGKVEEIRKQDGNNKYSIDGALYEAAANLVRNTEFTTPGIGMEAVFMLDYTGKLAALDTDSFRTYRYGWLVNFQKEKGLEAEYQVRIFNEDGEMKIFGLSDRFVLNGVKKNDLSEAQAPVLYEGGEVKSQLVRYEANGEKLTSIKTAEYISSSMPASERITRFTALPSSSDDHSATLYGAPLRTYEFKYLVQNRTKIFSVPDTYTKDADYKLLNPLSLTHLQSLPNVTFYDVLEDCGISAMTSVGISDVCESVGIITDVGVGLDADGLEVTRITVENQNGKTELFMENGQQVVLIEKSSNVKIDDVDGLVDKAKETQIDGSGNLNLTMPASALVKGDIIMYGSANSQGITSSVRVVCRSHALRYARWSYSSGDLHGVGKGSDYEPYVFTVGKIMHTSEYATVLETRTYQYVNYAWDWFTAQKPSSLEGLTYIMEYDAERDELRPITTAEFYDGDVLFTYRANLRECMMIVYRNLDYTVELAKN
ncbi:MAG: S-layer homology domain-containing protein [Clostridia bacterium]|nr:S-layer homology domain-containing protein [Clostridia bacterium]